MLSEPFTEDTKDMKGSERIEGFRAADLNGNSK